VNEHPNHNFVAGGWRRSTGDEVVQAINPATEEVFDQFCAATVEDASSAVEAATAAFPSWRKVPARRRAEALRRVAAELEREQQELADLETLDNGKPIAESLWDIGDAIDCFRIYADLAETLEDERREMVALPDDRFLSEVRLEPVGVAAQIIPWNYPLLMAAWKVAPALAAGATCVLKPSEVTSMTALRLGAALERAEVPAGVCNIVTGYGAEVGPALTGHSSVRKVAFTGSVPTGQGIMRAAANDIKSISLELGGKSPILVFEDADIEAAVEWIIFGIFWNQGQVCSATSRLLVDERIANQLMERLVEEARKIKIGPGQDPSVKLGPIVSKQQQDAVHAFIERARAQGYNPLTGGQRPPGLNKGYFVEPTIFENPAVDSEIWQEEIFGPVLCVRRFRTEDEAIRLANSSRFGLAAAVMSADLDRADRVANALEAGIVWINCSQPTFQQAPWGGYKQSGIGRELGRWGLQNYLETKQVTRYVSDQPWGWYL
jgi:betaine-aldehyde dehydrogenase